MPDDIYHYASLYLNHVAFGHELSLPELAKAEKAYVLWDWEGLAALAYEQFLQQGRGVLVGPRLLDDEESLTVVFDYLPPHAGILAESLDSSSRSRLASYLRHYHPELDLVVMWQRKNGAAACEWLRSDEKTGLESPRRLCMAQQAYPAQKAN